MSMSRRLRRYFLPDVGGEITQAMWSVFLAPSFPEGAKLYASRYDFERLGTVILVEHESFTAVPEGNLIPESPPPTSREPGVSVEDYRRAMP